MNEFYAHPSLYYESILDLEILDFRFACHSDNITKSPNLTSTNLKSVDVGKAFIDAIGWCVYDKHTPLISYSSIRGKKSLLLLGRHFILLGQFFGC
jgi:hypothetical protein